MHEKTRKAYYMDALTMRQERLLRHCLNAVAQTSSPENEEAESSSSSILRFLSYTVPRDILLINSGKRQRKSRTEKQ